MALSMDAASLEQVFPNLIGTQYRITSNRSVHYNCIAWAAGRTDTWWWPDWMARGYWPEGVARSATLASFAETFATLGYARCDDERLTAGEEHVAIYSIGESPSHAARQLPTGKWTSKLGKSVDIEYELHALTGDQYGKVALMLRRPLVSVQSE